MSEVIRPTDEQVERAARLICELNGKDPDALIDLDNKQITWLEWNTFDAWRALVLMLNKDYVLGITEKPSGEAQVHPDSDFWLLVLDAANACDRNDSYDLHDDAKSLTKFGELQVALYEAAADLIRHIQEHGQSMLALFEQRALKAKITLQVREVLNEHRGA